MALAWTSDVTVHLRDGYLVRVHDGRDVDVMHGASVAFDGGFAHIAVPGGEVQVVSAVAVWRASYPRD